MQQFASTGVNLLTINQLAANNNNVNTAAVCGSKYELANYAPSTEYFDLWQLIILIFFCRCICFRFAKRGNKYEFLSSELVCGNGYLFVIDTESMCGNDMK